MLIHGLIQPMGGRNRVKGLWNSYHSLHWEDEQHSYYCASLLYDQGFQIVIRPRNKKWCKKRQLTELRMLFFSRMAGLVERAKLRIFRILRILTPSKVPILQVVLLFRMQLWPVAHFFHSLLGGFGVALLLHLPKSEWKKVGNWSELHSEKKYYL